MVIYLCIGSQINILYWNGEEQPNTTTGKEARFKLYIGINSITGHTKVGGYLKATGCRISYSKGSQGKNSDQAGIWGQKLMQRS